MKMVVPCIFMVMYVQNGDTVSCRFDAEVNTVTSERPSLDNVVSRYVMRQLQYLYIRPGSYWTPQESPAKLNAEESGKLP